VPAPDQAASRPAAVSSPTAEVVLRSRPGAQERLRRYRWAAMLTEPWPGAGWRVCGRVLDDSDPWRGEGGGGMGRRRRPASHSTMP
jgi:hypothetical protein